MRYGLVRGITAPFAEGTMSRHCMEVWDLNYVTVIMSESTKPPRRRAKRATGKCGVGQFFDGDARLIRRPSCGQHENARLATKPLCAVSVTSAVIIISCQEALVNLLRTI